MKENQMEELNRREMLLSKDCTIELDDNILSVKLTYKRTAQIFLFLLIFSIFTILGLIPFFDISIHEIFSLLIFINSPFFVGYIYSNSLKIEWLFNKPSDIIIHKKIKPYYNPIKWLKVSDVNYLFYNHDDCWGSSLYLYLENKTKFYILQGSAKDCRSRGKIIANYLEKPLFTDKKHSQTEKLEEKRNLK